MKNILAENMLRFGVKNLSDKSKRKLSEQVVSANYTNLAGTYTMAELPAAMKTYNPQDGYIRIDGGNTWLATQRANSLKNFLVQQVPATLKTPFDPKNAIIAETKVLGSGDENQKVIGKLRAQLEKPPMPNPQYKFNIKYNWYDINGVPYIVNTKPGAGSPIEKAAPAQVNTLKSQMPSDDAIIVTQSTGGGSPTTGPLQYTAGMLIPITSAKFKYAALKDGTMYFNDENAYNVAKTFIMKYTAGGGGVGAEADIKKNSPFTDFTSNAGGGGNYILGKLGSGAKATILAGKGTGSDINITRMWAGKEGKIAGETDATTGQWIDLGTFELDKTTFNDNTITILPTAYTNILTSIKSVIDTYLSKHAGWKISLLTAEISGFASSDNATNRIKSGVTPDHTWGGSVTSNKWVTK